MTENTNFYLIDFNPRLERHACLSFLNNTVIDPCQAFQMIARGHHFQPSELPFFAPADLKYHDPSRTIDLDGKVLVDPSIYWNIETSDDILDAWMKEKVAKGSPIYFT